MLKHLLLHRAYTRLQHVTSNSNSKVQALNIVMPRTCQRDRTRPFAPIELIICNELILHDAKYTANAYGHKYAFQTYPVAALR